MIISASRRTDIPAFYWEWFMSRIKDKYCYMVNPFNQNQVSFISLSPADVDAIVFWTKNPKPMMEHLNQLDDLGYKYYFQYTLTGYSKVWEPNLPGVKENIDTFIKLSERIGKGKVIWRYDPIIFSNVTGFDYHYSNFTKLVDILKDYTGRVVISILDDFRGSKGRINKLRKIGIELMENPTHSDDFRELIKNMSSYAKQRGLIIYSCAEPIDLEEYGVFHGKCIDDEYIKEVFGIELSSKKDKGQRKECGCIESKDIGAYDTCMHGCIYCYANRNEDIIKRNFKKHRKDSPAMIGDL